MPSCASAAVGDADPWVRTQTDWLCGVLSALRRKSVACSFVAVAGHGSASIAAPPLSVKQGTPRTRAVTAAARSSSERDFRPNRFCLCSQDPTGILGQIVSGVLEKVEKCHDWWAESFVAF